MDEKKRTVTVEMDDIVSHNEGNGDETIDIPLADFIQRLTTALERVAPEHRAATRLHVWAAGDYARAYVDVRYDRPETDDELANRLARERRYEEQAAAREREQYERLKQKFG